MTPVGTVFADRFEVVSSGKWEPTLALDRETGRRVRIVAHWPFLPYLFLDRASVEEQHRRVAELDDPVLVPAIHADPIVVPHEVEEPRVSDEALVDAMLTLLAATRRARLAGFTVDVGAAWLEADGPRLPVPSAPPELHVLAFDRESHVVHAARGWLRPRIQRTRGRLANLLGRPTAWLEDGPGPHEVVPFARRLATRASDPAKARTLVVSLEPWPAHVNAALDFDRGIELGEAALAGAPDRWPRNYLPAPLAAALHHRACVRWHDGDAEDARRDILRAIELDPHTRYLTTAALIGAGNAGELLDRAIDAIPRPLDGEGQIFAMDGPLDRGELRARDASRTFHARASHRAKNGDVAGAIEDLDRSLASHPTDAARALLERLRAR